MKRRNASQHGWLRIAAGQDGIAMSGQAHFFKGYVVPGADGAEDGVSVEWHWDGERLLARTCSTGFMPLYYFFDGTQIALATQVEDIFAATGTSARLSPASLSLLLRLGFLVGNSTPFAGVFLLGPQGTLEWRPGTAPQVRSSYPMFGPSAAKDAAAQYAELFRDAMARTVSAMPADFALPLSGGRDSRHIALELHRLGRKPRFAITAYHLAPRNNEDVRIAAGLCRVLDWPHVTVAQPAFRRFSQEVAHAQAVDYLTFEHAWTLPLRDAIARHGVPQVFDGVGGDVLSAGLFQDEALLRLYCDGQIEAVRRGLLATWGFLGGEAALRETLGPELTELADPAGADAMLDAELRRHVDRPNPLKSFYFWNRSRRGTGLLPFRILGETTAYAPYLDRSVLSFLMGLAPEVTRDRQLHTEAIRHANPVFGAMAYEDKQARASARRISDRVSFYAPLLLRACSAGRYLNRRFVLPRAAQALLAGGDPQSIWWKPQRVAYLTGLHQFMRRHQHTRTQRMVNYAFNDR